MDILASLAAAWSSVKNLFSNSPPTTPVQACPAPPVVGPNWAAAAAAVFPGQQSFNNCGPQSSRQIVQQAAQMPLAKTETQFLDDAIAQCGAKQDPTNHPLGSGGTTAITRQLVLKQHGVDSTIEAADVASVDAALRARKGVIISANVNKLWATQGISQSGMHAVVVTHGDYDAGGALSRVHINDTGIGKRYTLTTTELADSLKSGSRKMNVTTNPIWPSN